MCTHCCWEELDLPIEEERKAQEQAQKEAEEQARREEKPINMKQD